MAFDIDRLVDFSIREIENFAESHQNELFYGFAIDASLLCLNSEQAAITTLLKYRDEWERDHRSIARWEDLTSRDIDRSESLLESEAEYCGLDLTDKDASLTVINKNRARERARGNPYYDNKDIYSLRFHTGGWAYQGFSEMNESVGFDKQAYDTHYHLFNDEKQKTSDYGKAMDELLIRLVDANAFSCLNLSLNFYATRVEHLY
jgi:hypothetical protein